MRAAQKQTASRSTKFFVGEVDGLGWLAATPDVEGLDLYFCIHGDTKEAAIQGALDAIKFFVEYKESVKDVRVSAVERHPFKAVEQIFVPSEVVFAEAC